MKVEVSSMCGYTKLSVETISKKYEIKEWRAFL